MRGTVNNKSNVIPIDKVFGFAINTFDFVMNTIITIINNGIAKIIRFFLRLTALFIVPF
jgi:hypothetical protein